MNPRQRIFWSVAATYLALFAATGGLALLVTYWATRPAVSAVLFGTAAVLLAGTAAALGAGLLLSRKFEKALFGFSGALQQAATGRYDVILPEESRQEFEELAAAMDHMTESVQSRSNQMQNERDRLRMVLNSMVEGVIAVDAAQRVIFFNTAASRLFKLREPASIGRPLWELVRHPRMQQWVAQALDRTEPVGGEMEMLDPVARILVVNVARFPVQPQFGAVVVVGDVTELRRLERIRQEFVANASHELKTPLASIKACVETLLDGASDDPKFRTKFLQSIDEQTDRLDELVRDMLTLARVESDALASEPRPISVNEVAEVSLGRHLQAAERKQVKMSAPEAAEPIVVLADEEALEQILDNLLDNAIKYTNPGGTVTLRLRAEDTQGVLEVEDTGIGIPHNQLPRIFERFYRVDRHRSRDIGGTGLGLSIVKHLVQAMGGSVSVASRLHQGTTFTVRLPLAARHA